MGGAVRAAASHGMAATGVLLLLLIARAACDPLCSPNEVVASAAIGRDEMSYLCDDLRPGDAVADVGLAGHSQFADCPRERTHGVMFHGFEPDAAACAQTRIGMSTALGDRHVDVRCKAASDSIGEVPFYQAAMGVRSSLSASVSAKLGFDVKSVPVARTTLDEELRRSSRTLRILKSDTQGHELSVLRGASELIRRHSPHLFVEFDPFLLAESGASAEQLLAQLHNFGYSCALVAKHNLCTPITNAANGTASAHGLHGHHPLTHKCWNDVYCRKSWERLPVNKSSCVPYRRGPFYRSIPTP